MTWTEFTGTLMRGAVYSGWATFAALFLLRRRPSQTATRPVVARASRATIGIAIQGVGFALVWGVRRPEPTPIWRGLPWLDVVVALAVAVLMIGSLTFSVLAVRELGHQWAVEARTIEHHELITTGPYGFVRHPIYASFSGFFLATGLAMTNWWALVVACLAFGLGTGIRVSAEEELLASTFGAAFEEYRRQVPVLIPHFRAASTVCSRRQILPR